MKNKKLKTIIVIVVSMIVAVFVAGLLINSDKSDSSSITVSRASNKTYTQVYTHHFDVSLSTDITGFPSGVSINFNVISNNPTPYQTLSDMDGDGYIISAFCPLEYNGNIIAVVEGKLFYSALNNGSLLVQLNRLGDNTVENYVFSNLNDFVVLDSVTAI